MCLVDTSGLGLIRGVRYEVCFFEERGLSGIVTMSVSDIWSAAFYVSKLAGTRLQRSLNMQHSGNSHFLDAQYLSPSTVIILLCAAALPCSRTAPMFSRV